MHPDNDEIRYDHSCKFWVERASLEAYYYMKGLDNMLWRSTSLLRSHTSGAPSSPNGEPGLSSGLAREALPETQGHHTTLWRGGATSIQQRFHDNRTDDIFHMSRIASSPGDFGGQMYAYWTPQRELAERYRRMTSHCHPLIEICIIQIAVPESVTNTLSKTILYSALDDQPNDDWRRVVWSGRNDRDLSRSLMHLDRDMMMGHIASGKHCKYQSMRNWTGVKISDRMEITVSNKTVAPHQWVFRTWEAKAAVEASIKDKVWFHKWNAEGRKLQ